MFAFTQVSSSLIPRCRGCMTPRRHFSVKEISWCTKTKNATKPSHVNAKKVTLGDTLTTWTPVDRFGIVACMSKNRIIGVDGRLPWDIPEDRNLFKELTKDRVLVIGRNTLMEELDLSHISHAAACIVMSRTLTKAQIDAAVISTSGADTEIHVAHSFPEALHIAREIEQMQSDSTSSVRDEFTDINCWIAGGEPVYNLAVMHPSAKVLHLTVVDTTIDDASTASQLRVARFPPKYHWDIRFKQVSAVAARTQAGTNYTHHELHRVKGRR